MENNTNSRDRILDAALKLFSEKGFNGTTVKEIAHDAEVSKALIYYNFESKEAILLEILDTFKEDFIKSFEKIYKKSDYSQYYGKWQSEEINDSLKFFNEKRRLWIVLILESLKSTTGKGNLIHIWDELNSRTRKKMLQDRGFTLQGDMTKDIVDLFFILIPAIFFSVFKDDWLTMNEGREEESANESFSYILNTIYATFLRQKE